jgi:outer membrane protein
VRQAYYSWLTARESIGVLEATAGLARENERVNDSLYRNGKVTKDLRLSAEAEHLEITQQLLRARAAEDLARRYLNLLCNAPLDREPEAPAVTDADLPRMARRIPTTRGVALEQRAVDRRAELRELDSGIAASGEAESAARAAFKPQLAFAVDAGTQGEEWDYSVEDSYVLASVILRFNLFNGGGDRAAIREARARTAGLAAGRQLAEQQIRIEVQEAITDLEVAEASLETASRRVEAADAAYAIIAKKRDLGQVSSAEYLDAQRALTQARLNGNVTRFQALGALAQVEYAIGGMEQP